VGRVAGHRGRGGELTVLVFGGDAAHWVGLKRFWIGPKEGREGTFYDVQSSRAYRDRLVLKLEGVDDPGGAEALRGWRLMAREEDAPRLPEGVYYTAKLIGMEVRDEGGRILGRVADVTSAGGADLLVIRGAGQEMEESGEPEEILIPLAKAIVIEVRENEGHMIVRPPEGLLELNRSGKR
jgi:16S rRNA processing protein RimM